MSFIWSERTGEPIQPNIEFWPSVKKELYPAVLYAYSAVTVTAAIISADQGRQARIHAAKRTAAMFALLPVIGVVDFLPTFEVLKRGPYKIHVGPLELSVDAVKKK
jgi:hypothetical protein